MSLAPPPPSLDIVIVNWNAGPLLRACLDSLPVALDAGFRLDRVVVVDNASSDASATGLEVPGVPLTVIANPANRGFSAGCNQGAAGSTADYLLFLNPDTRLLAGSLAPTLRFLEDPANARVGIAGVRLVDEAGICQRSCARAPTPGRLVAHGLGLDRVFPRLFPPHFMREWDHADTREVDQVMGAFLVIRRGLFERSGGFDERFFVYFDDVDLCLEARRAGFRVIHFAGAAAYHQGCGTTARIKDIRLFYSLLSRVQFAFKRFDAASAVAVAAAALVVEPLVRGTRALALARWAEAWQVARATGLLWRALPGVIFGSREARHGVDPSA